MTKKERVIAAINGRKTDGVPSCFSLHFPKEINSGVAGTNAHLKFFEETDTDILKIMNENLVPYLGSFTKAADYCGAIEDASASWAFVPAQIDFTRRILDRCDTSAFTLGTLHGICASGIPPIEAGLGYEPARLAQVNFLRVDENRTLDAMQRITDERKMVSGLLMRMLQETKLPPRACKRCRKPMQWNSPFSICRDCAQKADAWRPVRPRRRR